MMYRLISSEEYSWLLPIILLVVVLAVLISICVVSLLHDKRKNKGIKYKDYIPGGRAVQYEVDTVIKLSKAERSDNSNGKLIKMDILKSRRNHYQGPISHIIKIKKEED